MDIDDYAVRHPQFATDWLPPLLEETAIPGTLADIGCGDGATIAALDRRHLLGARTYAIDLSPIRVSRAASVAPGVVGLVADGVAVPLEARSVDGVVCAQVVEHVTDDRALVNEIARILRPGGWWYVGTVLRGPRAWWFYKVDGVRRLDPTHVREYESEAEFRAVLDHPLLDVSTIRSSPSRYHVSELVVRALGGGPTATRLHGRLPKLVRHLSLRVPGYHLLEAVGTRREVAGGGHELSET